MNPLKILFTRLFGRTPNRPYEAPGPDSVGISAISPGIKLEVVEVPKDVMGADPHERIRINASGNIFFKRDDGSVFTLTKVQDND